MILSRKLTSVSLLALSLFPVSLMSGCGAKNANPSETKFAHAKGNSLLGSPLARLEMLRQGRKTNFTRVPVCIERNRLSPIADADLVGEVRLVYATWVKASGAYTNEDFARFDFAVAQSCKKDDVTLAAYVHLLDPSEMDPNNAMLQAFKPASMNCTKSGNGYSCQNPGTVMGWGGMGPMSYSYSPSNPSKPLSFVAVSPAMTVLSPYVSWISLRDDLNANIKISPAVRATLLAAYGNLRTANFQQLVDFSETLARNGVEAGSDHGSDAAFQNFINGSQATAVVTYVPSVSLMHVLLHEVGHQFGMGHADNPSADMVTGNAGSAKQGADGLWRTSEATMAYALQYFYLTADDNAGAASAAKGIKDVMQ